MKYPFITFPDDTVITHSDIYAEDGKDKIKVYIEQPTDDGFSNATCILPDYSWQEINGFTDLQISDFQKFICGNVSKDDRIKFDSTEKDRSVMLRSFRVRMGKISRWLP